jgi:hypothetical protein
MGFSNRQAQSHRIYKFSTKDWRLQDWEQKSSKFLVFSSHFPNSLFHKNIISFGKSVTFMIFILCSTPAYHNCQANLTFPDEGVTKIDKGRNAKILIAIPRRGTQARFIFMLYPYFVLLTGVVKF